MPNNDPQESPVLRKATEEPALRSVEERLEEKHREGYRKKPVRAGEFPPSEARSGAGERA